jgi:hypothetical protein
MDWLHNVLYEEFDLLMRPSHDRSASPELKVQLLNQYFTAVGLSNSEGWLSVVSVYDDRQDVLEAMPVPEGRKFLRALDSLPSEKLPAVEDESDVSVPAVLRRMAATFEERNSVYSDNYLHVAPVMRALWPTGVPAELVVTDRWHLFELVVVKLTRFATSGLQHVDSVHDIAVYAAMIEADLRRKE